MVRRDESLTMATDPHLEAMELSAAVVAFRNWVATTDAIPALYKAALNRVRDDQIAPLAQAMVTAVDEVRDTNAPSQAQQQENNAL